MDLARLDVGWKTPSGLYQETDGWWFGIVVVSLGMSTTVSSISAPDPVSSWTGDHLQVGKPSRRVTATEVDSAFCYPWDDEMSQFSGWVIIINGDGGYGVLAAYIDGPLAQAFCLGPMVTGHLAPFCIHHVNRVNTRNGCAMMTAL